MRSGARRLGQGPESGTGESVHAKGVGASVDVALSGHVHSNRLFAKSTA